MNLSTKVTHKSALYEGVKFTVRRLTLMQRAKRDAAVADQRLEYTRNINEQRALLIKHVPGYLDLVPSEATKAVQALPFEIGEEMSAQTYRANLLHEEFLIPSSVKAGLVSIEGDLKIDDVAVTAANFLDVAPDDLLWEVYNACEAASGLTAEQIKN